MAEHVSFTRNPLKGSLCATCEFRASRVIIPFYEEEYGISRKEMGLDENEDVILEHHMCKELGIEIDHIVLECDHYCKKGSKDCFLRDKIYR